MIEHSEEPMPIPFVKTAKGAISSLLFLHPFFYHMFFLGGWPCEGTYPFSQH